MRMRTETMMLMVMNGEFNKHTHTGMHKAQGAMLSNWTKLQQNAPRLSGFFNPPYFFQYVQQPEQRRHIKVGGPQAYQCSDVSTIY